MRNSYYLGETTHATFGDLRDLLEVQVVFVFKEIPRNLGMEELLLN